MIDMIANCDKINVIGRLGENEHRRVLFPVAEDLEMYPGAVVSLLNRLPGTDTAYPVATTTTDSEYLYWTVTSADLTREGQGQCELVVMLGEVVAKSVIYITRVLTALDGSGEAPEPWDEWQAEFARMKAEAEAAAADAEAAAQAVQDMGVEGETLAPGSDVTVVKTIDPETGAVTLTFGIPRGDTGATGPQGRPGPQGKPGADGYSPIITITEITGGHQVTITDADGPHVFDVMNGDDGQPGAPGTPGSDGYSPTVTITTITGGHRVTITDADGAHSMDVMDGVDGETGATPDLSIGTVETLPPNNNATASITGTAENPVLNLGLPQGGVDLGVTGATVGQIAKITAVDANGKPTAWEHADAYPKKVFDLEYSGNWHKCNVAAIDYATGVITLDANDAPFTDDYNTAPMVWCVPLLEGIVGTYQWGFMPPELYSATNDRNIRGVLVGTNQIKIYKNATTSIDSITQTTNVDLSRFQIWATSYKTGYPSTDITNLDSNHRYRIVCSSPHGGECSFNVRFATGSGDVGAGDAYDNGYAGYGLCVNTNNKEQAYFAKYNRFESISFRGVKHYSTNDSMFIPFPHFIVVDLYRVSNGSWQISGVCGYNVWDNRSLSTVQATDKIQFGTGNVYVWLNAAPSIIRPAFNSNSGASFAPLDGDRFTIYDLGEGY